LKRVGGPTNTWDGPQTPISMISFSRYRYVTCLFDCCAVRWYDLWSAFALPFCRMYAVRFSTFRRLFSDLRLTVPAVLAYINVDIFAYDSLVSRDV